MRESGEREAEANGAKWTEAETLLGENGYPEKYMKETQSRESTIVSFLAVYINSDDYGS